MGGFQTVRGTRDLLAEDAERQRFIIDTARKTAELYGYEEVITPIVESYELLNAKSGEEIRQRLFIIEDNGPVGHRKIVLRPEFTASIARLATTTLRNNPKPWRIFSVGSVYRYDEPQRGRYREFWQSNFELMGSNKPEADAEIILLTNRLMRAVGLHKYEFKLGHVGILRAILSAEGIDEPTQNAILQRMDKTEYDAALELIQNCRCRQIFQELINLRMCDPFMADPSLSVERIKTIVRSYEKASRETQNLSEILNLVKQSGCRIKTVDPAFARGLEYYTGMIFEVYIPELDIALGGGGRYDRLIEAFGGEPTPAVGVAHGLDRIALAKQMQTSTLLFSKTGRRRRKKVLVIPRNEQLTASALRISELLRKARISTEFEVMGRKIGRVFEYADKVKPDYLVLVGEMELKEGKVVVKKWTRTEPEGALPNQMNKLELKVKIEEIPKTLRDMERLKKKDMLFEASENKASRI
ncbi:MAG TPA: histidine--tRNA ligase [Candidatus Bathyarchaeia archaeon]|nr:histidine--tRNA ligase [Candidatus Bathyarchaeia archaeon]